MHHVLFDWININSRSEATGVVYFCFMLTFSDFAGAIFDIDDTLLDNQPPGEPLGLHELSRLMAAQEVGRRHDIAGLRDFTSAQSTQAFVDAKVHTVFAAVWQMLVMAGEATQDEEMDLNNPLLQEIVKLKEELHEDLLRTKGREVPGATKFVAMLAENGLADKLAVASTACRRDIDVFFEMTQLGRFFPEARVISREKFTHAKPHPEPYNLAFAALGLPESARAKVVAFEDDPRGVMSAKAAGLYTCAITTRVSRERLAGLAVPPDLIAGSYAEFSELFGLPAKLGV